MNINCDSYWYETRNREKYNEQEGNHVVTLVKVTRAQLNDCIFIYRYKYQLILVWFYYVTDKKFYTDENCPYLMNLPKIRLNYQICAAPGSEAAGDDDDC